MPTTVFDASLTTARRKQLSLLAWRISDNYPSNPIGVMAEQAPSHGFRGTGPSAEVPLDVKQGAILAAQPNKNVYPNAVAACPTNCAAGVTLQGFVRNSPANSKQIGGSDNS
jgi:hypothetical protein